MDYTTKIVELSADIHTMWRLQCQNLYNSKNLGALAVRECIQNSIDSIKSALKQKQISKGRIDIDFSCETGDMSISDNGIGMDIETIHTKFLTLGGTTKDDEENTGGFGLAKSVILGCGSAGFKVETQDNVFTSNDLGKSPIQKQKWRQGTKITLYKVQVDQDQTLDTNNWLFEESILDYVATSRIPKSIEIFINSHPIVYTFKPTLYTRRIPAVFNIKTDKIPRDTELEINVYKSQSSICYLYVQLRGLTQFKKYLGWNSNCDIVLNFKTSINPRSTDYPFSTNRENLKANYQGIIEAIQDKVSQAPLSITSESKYKELLYDNVDDGSSRQYETAVALGKVATSAEVTKTASIVKKVLNGMEVQGGYSPSNLSDHIQQYNSTVDSLAKEHNLSKSDVVKQLTHTSLFQLNNPLKFSWIICKSKSDNIPNLRQSKAVSYVLKWDAILKLMCASSSATNNSIFYPGLILEQGTLGLCMEKYLVINNTECCRKYIMFNPFACTFTDPLQQAIWIMSVAAHELAHWVCNTFEAHGETWAYTREQIMNDNLFNISKVVKIMSDSKTKKPYSKFSTKSIEELNDLARSYGINVEELQAKYKDVPIYRMRLVMQLKKAEAQA